MKIHFKKLQILIIILLCIFFSSCSAYNDSTISVTKIDDTPTSITEASETTIAEEPQAITKPEPSTTPEPSTISEPSSTPELSSTTENSSTNAVTGKLIVSFIDVGQADCILIQAGSSSLLIDAGNNGDAYTVVNYIKKQGISKLDYVIGTHPHEDHIGGLDAVIEIFDIDKIYMPKVTTTTKTFEDVILAIKNKGLKITTPTPGSTFSLGDAKFKILAPNSDKYEELNDYSIVLKLEFGKTAFLFTGDSQTESENEMLNKSYELNADVLKVGHHGSDTSTSPEFFKAVSPKYAVISVGDGNDYGHPKQVILQRLAEAGVQVFRTDKSGTIVATTDGETIEFDIKASAIKPQAPPKTEESKTSKNTETVIESTNTGGNNDVIVYITKTGEKYHADGCRYLSKSKIEIKLSEAVFGKYNSERCGT